MLLIGHENYVKSEAIVVIIRPDNAPSKKLRYKANEERMLITATSGRKARSIIVMQSNHIVLSSLQPKILISRLENMKQQEKSEQN